jgi:hypothetical protein
MRLANQYEIGLSILAIRILNTRFHGGDENKIRSVDNADIEITSFPIGNGRGLSINHCKPNARPRNVFVLHHRRSQQPQTLCFIAGPWEENLKQLAAETKPRKLELVR